MLVLKIYRFPFLLGNPTIVILVLFQGGIQLICIGILGEYIGRFYEEFRQRLKYIIERSEDLSTIPKGLGNGESIAKGLVLETTSSGLFQFLESGTRTDMSSISLGSSSTTRRLSACLEMETNGSHISARRLLLMRSYMSWPKRQHDPQSTVAKFIISAPKSCTVKNSISRICERLKVTPTLEFTGGEKGWTGDNPFIFGYDQGAKNGLEFRANHSHAVERTVDWLVANQWVFRK